MLPLHTLYTLQARKIVSPYKTIPSPPANTLIMSKTTITIDDLTFAPYISKAQLQDIVQRMATDIRADLAALNPVCMVVLNGAFFFASDLIKAMDIQCEIHFVKLQSYAGTSSTGAVTKTLDATVELRGRHVLIIEDIIDTGLTMSQYIPDLLSAGVAQVHLATLLTKPSALLHDVEINYCGIEIPDVFVVGYGLDYDQRGRHLQHIYKQVD